MNHELITSLVKSANTKIVLLVIDGLGGIPARSNGETELESAHTPNLDQLAVQSICGLHQPIASGVTPGSGPSHLALFGYDPTQYQVGRGVLSALGIDFDLKSSDVAARGNFCTVDDKGRVTDRRAGRISTEKNEDLCELLREIKISGAEVFVETVEEHRFALILRSNGLSDELTDTDPLETGREPNEPQAKSFVGQKTVNLVKNFLHQAREVLADQYPANMILLRGFSRLPDWPKFGDIYGLQAAAIAAYPMYRGVARLLDMDAITSSAKFDEAVNVLENHWDDYDFFFLHYKDADSAGEDGDFERKVKLIEGIDVLIPRLRNLNPDVLVVTGDHSSPARLGQHSWHPVPLLLWSKYCRADLVCRFGERNCVGGALGSHFKATDLMPLILANAMRLKKFGA
jgi:2,3-bisphosphoglycerate-independent phosphoglycerate mutase